jgi:hypothetical protein
MDNKYITKKELNDKINEKLQKLTLKDKKWLYCYFYDFDEWPLVVDERPLEARPLVSGEGVWAGGEEVPF